MSDVEAAAQTEPANPSLRDALTAAYEAASADVPSGPDLDASEPASAAPDATPDATQAPDQGAPAADGLDRDKLGRFKAQDKAEEPAQAADAAAPDAGGGEPDKSPDADIPLPEGVNGALKEHWNALPADVRKAVAEREAQVSKGFKEYSEKTKAWSEVDKLMEPIRPALVADGKTPAAYVGELLQLSDVANKDPAYFAKWFVEARGLDPKAVFGLAQATEQQPAHDPALDDPLLAPIVEQNRTLQAKLEQLEKQLGGVMQQGQMATRTQFEAAIGQFLTDTEKYPYAQALEQDIADAIVAARSKGQQPGDIVASLPAIYERAAWANPDVRQHILADQKAKEEAQRAEEAEKRAQEEAERKRKAQAASGSLSGAPTTGIRPSGNPPDNLRDHITQLVHAQMGGARV